MTATLSPYEQQVITDARFLLAKNNIINKVIHLFGEVAVAYEQNLQLAGKKADGSKAKISKGDQYKGLPWVMLDYPRQFSKGEVLAVRSFFWWGNYFSITLQLQGSYLLQNKDALKRAIENGNFTDWLISKGDDMWNHEITPGGYEPVHVATQENIDERQFVKLAKKIPLSKWDESVHFFSESFLTLAAVLHL